MPVFHALATCDVAAVRRGALDAYGRDAERHISDGVGKPCRHCLRNIEEGAPYLIVAHRPFTNVNAYTETGPIFVHAGECQRAEDSQQLPEILTSPDYIVRGYSADERIVYGTGGVIATAGIPKRAAELLSRTEIAFVDIRSSSNNCFQCRVKRNG